SERDFLAEAKILSTETFDEFPIGKKFGAGTAIVDGVTYTAADEAAVWQTGSSGAPAVSAPNKFGTNRIQAETLTFGSGMSTNAIGLALVFGGSSEPPAQSRITATSALGMQATEVLSFALTDELVAYRGFVAPEGIVSVRIENIPDPTIGFNF